MTRDWKRGGPAGRRLTDQSNVFGAHALLLSHIEHEPGGPPQRPQVGASLRSGMYAPGSFPDGAAKTLSARAVFIDPHFGHFTFASVALIERAK